MRNVYIWIGISLLAVCMMWGIAHTQEFRFYALESNFLFLYDWTDIFNKVSQPGGLALVVASFLTQFWRFPFVGVFTIVALYLLIAFVLYRVLRVWKPGISMVGMTFLPIVFLFLCIENDYYRFQGHIAFLMMSLALWAYVTISIAHYRLRFVAGVCLTLLLFYIAGSISIVFAIAACVADWCTPHKKIVSRMMGVIYIGIAVFVAILSAHASVVKDVETSLTPLMYYDWPSTYFFPLYAWALIPVLILSAYLLSKVPAGKLSPVLLLCIGLVLSAYLSFDFYKKVHSERGYRFLQEQYWADNGEWNEIITTANRTTPVYFLSYLNLALAEKDCLVDRMNLFNQQSPKELLMWADPNLKNGKRLLSKIYTSWGYVAEARQAAFDANLVTPGSCHPLELQTMIQTNLVLGAYEVAEKYIVLLEKTLYYDEWATGMRRFLNDEEAVRKDPVLGSLYVSLPIGDHYVRYESLLDDMKAIITANPEQRIATQFYQVYSEILKGK